MKNKHLLNLILVAICIMTLAVLAYVFNFWSQKISNDTGDWGAFSDYLNPFVSFLNLIILGWLSFVVFKYNSNRDKQNDFFQKSLERPIIIAKSFYFEGGNPPEIWEIQNIGNGVALNLKITYKSNRENNYKTPVIKAFSLARSEKLELNWIEWSDVIFITYQDLFENEYITVCADNESYTQPLNDDFKNIEIVNKTFEKEYILKIKGLKHERIHWARIYGKSQITDGLV